MLVRTPILALAILAAPGGPSTFGEEPDLPGAQEGRQPLPGTFRFRVGKVRVAALSDGTVPINLHELLRDTTECVGVVGPKRAAAREPDMALAALKTGKILRTHATANTGGAVVHLIVPEV